MGLSWTELLLTEVTAWDWSEAERSLIKTGCGGNLSITRPSFKLLTHVYQVNRRWWGCVSAAVAVAACARGRVWVLPWSSDTGCWCCWTSEPGRCACCPGCGRCTRSSSVQTEAAAGSGPAGWWASWRRQGCRSEWREGSEDTPVNERKYKELNKQICLWEHFMQLKRCSPSGRIRWSTKHRQSDSILIMSSQGTFLSRPRG